MCTPTTEGTTVIGTSTFAVRRGADSLSASIALDEPIPGSSERLQASLEVRGCPVVLPALPMTSPHVWTPRLLHARGSVELQMGGRRFAFDGTAYFDGNAATVPLTAQGIERWLWGRASTRDRTWVTYLLEGTQRRTFLMEGLEDGTWEALPGELTWTGERKGRYGVSVPATLELPLPGGRLVIPSLRSVEDGPFYRRLLLDGLCERDGNQRNEPVRGTFEVVRPSQLDLPWQRPFVRMRTHRVGAPNSPWLPLFSGWRDDRWRRLLRGSGTSARGEEGGR